MFGRWGEEEEEQEEDDDDDDEDHPARLRLCMRVHACMHARMHACARLVHREEEEACMHACARLVHREEEEDARAVLQRSLRAIEL